MFFRGGRRPSKVSVLVGQDHQGDHLRLCTVVLGLAAQVIPRAVLTCLDIFTNSKNILLTMGVCVH